jgi:hypothetical protein
MAELVKDEKSENKLFPREPLDKRLLLGSLKDFQKDGVVLGVEKVITPKMGAYGKVNMPLILTVLGSMPKARQYNLDDDGQYQYYTDERTGEERVDVIVDDGQLKTVFFPFYAVPKGDGSLDEYTTLYITPGTSSYPLFREALIEADALPSDMGKQAFNTNFNELKEALEGFEFLGKYAVGGTKNKFEYLDVERVDLDGS